MRDASNTANTGSAAQPDDANQPAADPALQASVQADPEADLAARKAVAERQAEIDAAKDRANPATENVTDAIDPELPLDTPPDDADDPEALVAAPGAEDTVNLDIVDPDMQHASRIDRLEAAVGAEIGVDLSEYDGQSIRAQRDAILREAADKAAQVIEDAFVATSDLLSKDDRVARIERALGLPSPNPTLPAERTTNA